jgi:hypothetical protein
VSIGSVSRRGAGRTETNREHIKRSTSVLQAPSSGIVAGGLGGPFEAILPTCELSTHFVEAVRDAEPEGILEGSSRVIEQTVFSAVPGCIGGGGMDSRSADLGRAPGAFGGTFEGSCQDFSLLVISTPPGDSPVIYRDARRNTPTRKPSRMVGGATRSIRWRP